MPILIDTTRPGRVRRDGGADRARLRRHPPRGHPAPECFEIEARADRGARRARHARRRPRHRGRHPRRGRWSPAGRLGRAARGRRRSASSASARPGFGIATLMHEAGAKRVLASDPNEASHARARERRHRDRRLGDRDGARPTSSSRPPAGPGLITPEMVRPGQVILALTNPVPEIEPDRRARGGRRVRRRRHVGQQRARLPGHLPRRAGRRRARDHDPG